MTQNGDYYNMSHKNRGLALIFNHEFFDRPDLDDRIGTNADCAKLERVLEKLYFDVKVFKDCTLKELYNHLEFAAQQDHSDSDCILIAILTHGEFGNFCTKDTEYALDNVWNYFSPENCPTLADKPKIFIVQACHGKVDKVSNINAPITSNTEFDDEMLCYTEPMYEDMIIAYSTLVDFYSSLNPGSWFVQSLCAELEKKGSCCDLYALLCSVVQDVAIKSKPTYEQWYGKKLSPSATKTLKRKLMFTDKCSISGE